MRTPSILLIPLLVAAACGDSGGPAGSPRVTVDPLLDSLFVGDTLQPGALTATYIGAGGDTLPAGQVIWASADVDVVEVDSLTGRVVAVGPGEAIIIARANGCSVDDVIARHSGTDHWVSCVGWAPGCYFAYPIDRARGVTAPKLVTARPYTPARILTLGGLCTAALPFAGPSGYQMLGRLAAPTYQAQPTLAGFPAHGVPFEAGDRHRYVPVDALGYEAVREEVASGTFVGLPGRAMQWVFDKRALFGDAASHLSLVSSGASAIVDRTNQELIDLALRELRAALPAVRDAELRRAVVVREKRATFSVAPGQPRRPSTKTSLPGLFLAGDWIDTGLPATIESAVVSGHAAAAAVMTFLTSG